MTTEGGPAGQIGMVLRAPKTGELIASHLRRQIVRGELRNGEVLPPERQLTKQYGVSRPTLREAFRILESEELISVRRGTGGGPQVIAPDGSVAARYVGLVLQMQGTTLGDVYEARMAAEPPCARLLALRHTDADIEKLLAVVTELKAEVAARKPLLPEPDVLTRLVYRFHALILEGSGNKTMTVQGAVLQGIISTHLRANMVRRYDEGTAERIQRVIRSYVRLVNLVKAGNAAGAERHWRSHMEDAGRYLLSDDLSTKAVVDLFS